MERQTKVANNGYLFRWPLLKSSDIELGSD